MQINEKLPIGDKSAKFDVKMGFCCHINNIRYRYIYNKAFMNFQAVFQNDRQAVWLKIKSDSNMCIQKGQLCNLSNERKL